MVKRKALAEGHSACTHCNHNNTLTSPSYYQLNNMHGLLSRLELLEGVIKIVPVRSMFAFAVASESEKQENWCSRMQSRDCHITVLF